MGHNRTCAGSSPRVRGKLRWNTNVSGWVRLIPARAGKTSASRTMRRRGAAHPRACGENTTSAAPSALPRGSSPRVRGKPGAEQLHQGVGGLIPACAGKTELGPRGSVSREAHPRVCGENSIGRWWPRGYPGSSPRVRGKRRAPQGLAQLRGLIPACAGKTPPRRGPGGSTRAHPRVCGENMARPRRDRSRMGSSPRVRGKPTPNRGRPARRGLIPACAGKTGVPPVRPRGERAHPRVCGENRFDTDPLLAADGSSPRVRGKRRSWGFLPGWVRLIPACAGKTRARSAPPSRPSAHPRVCGENTILAGDGRAVTGSSPRVRGKRLERPRAHPQRRLIPACAGKTPALMASAASDRAHPRACGENWRCR